MGLNMQGFEYEGEVISTLRDAGIAGDILEGAGASSVGADADFIIFGDRHLVEIKMDSCAQMGGTSLRYANGCFESASNSMDVDTEEILKSVLDTKIEDIDRLLGFLGRTQLPMSCEKAAWDSAKTAGLLKPINCKVRKDTDFLANHYEAKGVDYIQIGGAGLFYLKDNPAGLPVPKLEGELDIEMRAGRSGSRKNSNGVEYVGGSIRAQGRLKFTGVSPYTLDRKESIMKMLEVMNEK